MKQTNQLTDEAKQKDVCVSLWLTASRAYATLLDIIILQLLQ